MVTELLTQYGPITGLWLDIVLAHYMRPDLSPYEMVKSLVKRFQPEALLSYKQGADGTEDFATPEQHFHSLKDMCLNMTGDMEIANRAERTWEINKNKHNEICATLQDEAWGYKKAVRHKSVDDIVGLLGHAANHNCNLLLNAGPLPDGSIHPEDIKALKGIGKYIRNNGWPEAKKIVFKTEDQLEMDN
jgi:alpha-L-fucosidase